MLEHLKRLSILFFILSFFASSVAKAEQDSTNVSPEQKKSPSFQNVSDNLSFHLTPPVLQLKRLAKPLLFERLKPDFKQSLKYDTTWNNPDNRCYEFKKPLTSKYLFMFKLISKQQYESYRSP